MLSHQTVSLITNPPRNVRYSGYEKEAFIWTLEQTSGIDDDCNELVPKYQTKYRTFCGGFMRRVNKLTVLCVMSRETLNNWVQSLPASKNI